MPFPEMVLGFSNFSVIFPYGRVYSTMCSFYMVSKLLQHKVLGI